MCSPPLRAPRRPQSPEISEAPSSAGSSIAGRGSQMAPPAASLNVRPPSLPLQRKDGRRVHPPHDLAVTGPAAEVHVHPAGQAWVEGTDRPHDVDALEVLGLVLLEDRGVLHRVLVGSRGPVDVPDAPVPWGRGVPDP